MAPPVPDPAEADDIASRFYDHYLQEIPEKYASAFLDFLSRKVGFEAPIAEAIMRHFPAYQFARPGPERIITFERQRPLNGYLVFRAYISPALPGVSQKAKSGFIGTLWHHDPHQAQWIIMALAYTTLRDNFELDERSVPTFARLVAIGLFGFPVPDLYIRMSGWIVNLNNMKLCTRVWGPNFGALNLRPVTTHDEIVQYCIDEGFALCQKFNSTWLPDDQISALAVAQGSRDTRPIPPKLRLVLDQNDEINFDFSEFSLVEVFGSDFTSSLPPQWPALIWANASIPALAQAQAQQPTQAQAQPQVQAQPQAQQQPQDPPTNP